MTVIERLDSYRKMTKQSRITKSQNSNVASNIKRRSDGRSSACACASPEAVRKTQGSQLQCSVLRCDHLRTLKLHASSHFRSTNFCHSSNRCFLTGPISGIFLLASSVRPWASVILNISAMITIARNSGSARFLLSTDL